jgi:hypothetical protein
MRIFSGNKNISWQGPMGEITNFHDLAPLGMMGMGIEEVLDRLFEDPDVFPPGESC